MPLEHRDQPKSFGLFKPNPVLVGVLFVLIVVPFKTVFHFLSVCQCIYIRKGYLGVPSWGWAPKLPAKSSEPNNSRVVFGARGYWRGPEPVVYGLYISSTVFPAIKGIGIMT
jgi:hypothetical protein